MRISRSGFRTVIAIALICAIAAFGLLGCSETDDKAMVQAAGDFVVALVSLDGEAVLALVPSSVADENPELRDAEGAPEEIEFSQEWDGDVLVISAVGDETEEVYRLWAGEDGEVVEVEAGPEQIELVMAMSDGAWVVTEMDGTPVGDILELMLMASGEDAEAELDAEADQLYCHAEQALWELAAAVLAADEGQVSMDPSAYVPDLMEELTYCPSSESQYSLEKSTNGYLDGMSPDGTVAPCSVHGAPEDE